MSENDSIKKVKQIHVDIGIKKHQNDRMAYEIICKALQESGFVVLDGVFHSENITEAYKNANII